MYSSADFDRVEKTNLPNKGWNWGIALSIFYAFIQIGLRDEKIVWSDIEAQWEQLIFWRVLALFQRLFMHFLFFNLFSPLDLSFFSLQWRFWKRLRKWRLQEYPCSREHWLEHFLGKRESSTIVVPLLGQKKVKSCVSHLQGKLVNN